MEIFKTSLVKIGGVTSVALPAFASLESQCGSCSLKSACILQIKPFKKYGQNDFGETSNVVKKTLYSASPKGGCLCYKKCSKY